MTKTDRDIVISTRTRLARSLADLPFPSKMKDDQEVALVKRIEARANANADFTVYLMRDLAPIERQILIERHLASPELAGKPNAALLLSKDERISLLVGEEDHLRIQCIVPGLSIEDTDTQTRALDALLSAEGYAFDERLGYLTSCPTNVGTGMRASVMMHLNALTMAGQMKSLIEMAGKFGFTIRGYYGEGSEAAGDMYQLSNQVTLGVSEDEIMTGLLRLVRSILSKERAMRDTLLNNDKGLLVDRLHRSLGILKYARRVNTAELMQRLGDVRLGLSLNLFDGVSFDEIESLITRCQPASIESQLGSDTTPELRDETRAKIVRATLKNCHT